MRERELLIDGKLLGSAAGATFVTTNPATGDPASLIPRAGARDARRAADAARRAADDGRWSETAPAERRMRLLSVADALWERQAEIADCETAEAGIPVRIASSIVAGAIERFRAAVERALPRRNPHGAVALLPPADAPFARSLGMIGPALAAGNTIALNAPPGAPAGTLELARAFWESDVPGGVVNVVCGGRDVEEELAGNPLIDTVVFAGPAATARRIAETVAPSLRPAIVHAGGPASAIVLGDADFDLAVPGVLFGAMFLSGRTHRPLSRAIVGASIAEPFVHHLVRGANALRTGDPASFSTDLGPVAGGETIAALERVLDRGIAEGATIACGGRRLERPGSFFAPTIVAGASSRMRIARESISAPLLVVVICSSEDELVALADESPGDVAVWGRDADPATRLSRRLRAERIWINDYDPLSAPEAEADLTRVAAAGSVADARSRQALIGLDAVFGFEAPPER